MQSLIRTIHQKTSKLKYGRSQVVEFALRALEHADNPSVLDLGVGTGNDLLNIKRAYGNQLALHGLEIEEKRAHHCERKGVSTHIVNVERDTFPFDDATFDLIVSNQTFEHIKDVFWCLSETCRTLKPGGHLLLGVPNIASPHCSLPLLFGRQPRQIKTHGPHVRGFTIDGVRELLLTDGFFKEITYTGAGFYPFPKTMAQWLAKTIPSHAVSLFCLFERTELKRSFIDNFKQKYDYETSYFTG